MVVKRKVGGKKMQDMTYIAIPRNLREYIESKKIIKEEPVYKVLYRLLEIPNGKEGEN